jgi:hypothetical protein
MALDGHPDGLDGDPGHTGWGMAASAHPGSSPSLRTIVAPNPWQVYLSLHNLLILISTRTAMPVLTPAFLADFLSVLALNDCGSLFGIDTVNKAARPEMAIGDASVVVPSNDSDCICYVNDHTFPQRTRLITSLIRVPAKKTWKDVFYTSVILDTICMFLAPAAIIVLQATCKSINGLVGDIICRQ